MKEPARGYRADEVVATAAGGRPAALSILRSAAAGTRGVARVEDEAEAQHCGEQRERGGEAEALAVRGLVEAGEQVFDGGGVDVVDGAPVEADGASEDLCVQILGEIEVLEARRQLIGCAGGHAGAAIVGEFEPARRLWQ